MTMLFCSAVVSPGRANTRLTGALLTAAHVPGDLSQSLDTAERYLLESNATVAAHVRKVRGLFFGGRTNVPVDASTLATVESALTRLIGNFPSDLTSAKAHAQAELLTSVSVFATLYGLRKRHAELMQRCSLLASTALDLLSAPTEEGAEMLKVMKARAQAVAAQPLFAESKTHATLMQGHTAGTELVVGVPVDPTQCLGALAFGSPSSAPWPADQHPVVATLDQHAKSTFVAVARTEEAVGETTLYDDKVTRDMGFAPVFVDATSGEEVTSVTSLRRLVTGGVDVRFTAVSPAAAPAPAPAAAAPVIVPPPPVTGSPSSPTASSVSTVVATSKASSAGTILTPPGSAKPPSPKTTPKGASAPPPSSARLPSPKAADVPPIDETKEAAPAAEDSKEDGSTLRGPEAGPIPDPFADAFPSPRSTSQPDPGTNEAWEPDAGGLPSSVAFTFDDVVNNADELPPSQPEEKGDEEDGPTLRDPAVSESDPFADAFPDSPSQEDPATEEAWQGPSDPSGPATFSLEDLMEPSAPPKAAKKAESEKTAWSGDRRGNDA
jgi:hypothetical protein